MTNTYLLLPFSKTLCSNIAVRSLGRGAISCSLLINILASELLGSKEPSNLLILLTPGEDFDLQNKKLMKHKSFVLFLFLLKMNFLTKKKIYIYILIKYKNKAQVMRNLYTLRTASEGCKQKTRF